jgi:hypothetical protein
MIQNNITSAALTYKENVENFVFNLFSKYFRRNFEM